MSPGALPFPSAIRLCMRYLCEPLLAAFFIMGATRSIKSPPRTLLLDDFPFLEWIAIGAISSATVFRSSQRGPFFGAIPTSTKPGADLANAYEALEPLLLCPPPSSQYNTVWVEGAGAMPYVFYDTETTGLQTAFDQILQFAAIRLDDQLNETDSFNIRCRLLPHVVPSPGALIATGISPYSLLDPSLPTHYEAVGLIRNKLLQWSPAVFMGWNSIRFDEELVRQTLFQTLHPVYLTKTQGNARADAMRLALTASVYSSSAIKVPTNANGDSSFRLDQIAPANGYAHDNAHEAMADVRATIFMARLIKEAAPEVWKTLARSSRKQAILDFIKSQPTLSLTERDFGRINSWLVVPCGYHPVNTGEVALFDLSHDPADYINMSPEQIAEVLKTKGKKPIRTVRANAHPIVMDGQSVPATTLSQDLSSDERSRRRVTIAGASGFHRNVGIALTMRYADQPVKVYPEQRIYDGFYNDDAGLMQQFHRSDWSLRPSLIGQFKDSRMADFAERIIFFNRPDCLPDETHSTRQAWLTTRLSTEEQVPWMTLPKAMAQANGMLANASAGDAIKLEEIKDFLAERRTGSTSSTNAIPAAQLSAISSLSRLTQSWLQQLRARF
jgi:exodeoxyribonuclease-1